MTVEPTFENKSQKLEIISGNFFLNFYLSNFYLLFFQKSAPLSLRVANSLGFQKWLQRNVSIYTELKGSGVKILVKNS